MVGCLIGHPNQIPNHLIINASFINSFFFGNFQLISAEVRGSGELFLGKTLTRIVLSEAKVRISFRLVSIGWSQCVRSGYQGKEVSSGLSGFF